MDKSFKELRRKLWELFNEAKGNQFTDWDKGVVVGIAMAIETLDASIQEAKEVTTDL